VHIVGIVCTFRRSTIPLLHHSFRVRLVSNNVSFFTDFLLLPRLKHTLAIRKRKAKSKDRSCIINSNLPTVKLPAYLKECLRRERGPVQMHHGRTAHPAAVEGKQFWMVSAEADVRRVGRADAKTLLGFRAVGDEGRMARKLSKNV